jgi:hypothetical protein
VVLQYRNGGQVFSAGAAGEYVRITLPECIVKCTEVTVRVDNVACQKNM